MAGDSFLPNRGLEVKNCRRQIFVAICGSAERVGQNGESALSGQHQKGKEASGRGNERGFLGGLS